MYLSKEYNQENRQIEKYMGKMTWYQSDGENYKEINGGWRRKLKGVWEGAKPVQRKVKGMEFTTVLQVPNTENSALLSGLAKKEPKIAKLSGYNVKIVEKSGI